MWVFQYLICPCLVGSLRGWIAASALPLGMSFTILGIFHMIIRKLDSFIKDKED